MAFCTVAQFLRTVDNRVVREHLSDSGTPVAQADLADNETLEQLLEEATEMVKSAVMVRQKYTLDELDEMAESATEGFLLRRLTANLAFGLLMMRRARPATDLAKLAPQYQMALFDLAQIRDGVLLFPRLEDQSHPEAGLPSVSGDLGYDTTTDGFRSLSNRAGRRLFPCRPKTDYGD